MRALSSRAARRAAAGLGPIALAALVACSKGEPPAAPDRTPAAAAWPVEAAPPAAATGDGHAQIAWRQAAGDADVDAAFAAARSENKPLFLYWGAKWCPPCNQVKATLFNRQDFIERSRAFVPVYVDGDTPGAQKLGTRFRVSGYPTMLLFNPKGEEVTRLPGEAEPKRYDEALDLGMNAVRPVKALVADALAGGRGLSAADWRLLALYSWETDQQQAIGTGSLGATLAKVAAACPESAGEAATRLTLKALGVRDDKAPLADAATRDRVLALLADPARSRAEADMVVNYAPEIARSLAAARSAERSRVVAAFDGALQRLGGDATLSRADRMAALIARVNLVRLDEPEAKPNAAPAAPARPKLPPALLADVRAAVARDDAEITDGYERQAVVTAAAYLLERSGLDGESDALLQGNLAKSHSPYYLMSELASNARKRGDAKAAVAWSARAFDASEGPATRLQWGASHLATLVDLQPQDEAAIEATAARIWQEAAAQPDAFQQRSERSLQKVGKKLVAWNAKGGHAAAMRRLQLRLDALCAARADDAQGAACKGLLREPAKPTA